MKLRELPKMLAARHGSVKDVINVDESGETLWTEEIHAKMQSHTYYLLARTSMRRTRHRRVQVSRLPSREDVEKPR